MAHFQYRSRIEVPVEELFAWHTRPGAFERLTPPWESARVVERNGYINDGARAVVEMHVGPFRRKWVALHKDYIEGRQFSDTQLNGPFAAWDHTHLFEPDGPSASIMDDSIDYQLPFGLLGRLGVPFAERRLRSLFAFRHGVLARDLATHQAYEGGHPSKVLVTGSTGLIGSALVPFLTTSGHSVTRLVRGGSVDRPSVRWDPDAGEIDVNGLEGHDAVVHLAGESIGQRWSEKTKREILESRVQGTRLLVESLVKLSQPPKVLVSASAMGYYGDRGDEILTEGSSSGSLFLSEVCREWEAETQPAAEIGIRVVNVRNALVLSPRGGALKPLLLPIRLGLGGRVGSGR